MSSHFEDGYNGRPFIAPYGTPLEVEKARLDHERGSIQRGPSGPHPMAENIAELKEQTIAGATKVVYWFPPWLRFILGCSVVGVALTKRQDGNALIYTAVFGSVGLVLVYKLLINPLFRFIQTKFKNKELANVVFSILVLVLLYLAFQGYIIYQKIAH